MWISGLLNACAICVSIDRCAEYGLPTLTWKFMFQAAEASDGNPPQTPPGPVDFPMVRPSRHRTVLWLKKGGQNGDTRSGLDEAGGDGDPERGLLRTRTGSLRSDLSQNACLYGFSIIAKVKEGREEAVRAYGKTIEETIAASPEALAPLRLHYLRWVLFDVGSGLHFQCRGILTRTSTSAPRTRSSCSARRASRPCLPTSRGSPRTGRRTRTRS